jgi:tetratricopeptide (TPR) repeat protein
MKNGKPRHRPEAKLPDHVAAVVADLVAVGQSAVDRGDIDAAVRALNGAASRAPKDRGVLHLKALVLSAEGDPEAALEVLDLAIDRFPDDIALVADKVFILLDEIGDAEEALPLLHECIARLGADDASIDGDGDHNDDVLLLELSLRLVDAHLALGDVKDAVGAANDAIAVADGGDHNDGLARAALARALMASGDLVGARENAERAVDAANDDADVLTVLGRVCITAGDDDGAAAAFERARAIDPDALLPPRLSPAAFQGRVDDVVAGFPQPLRGYVQKLNITYALHADVERLRRLERSPETPFLLDGPERATGGRDPFSHRPTGAVMYQRSVETLCGHEEELDDAIAAVLVEGVGMFLGLDFDEDLAGFVDIFAED